MAALPLEAKCLVVEKEGAWRNNWITKDNQISLKAEKWKCSSKWHIAQEKTQNWNYGLDGDEDMTYQSYEI